jgi:hypothetical protein
MSDTLVTVAATARLTNESGRSLVTLRGHHLVVDAPLILGGPNEEVNPMDLLLASRCSGGRSRSARDVWLSGQSALAGVAFTSTIDRTDARAGRYPGAGGAQPLPHLYHPGRSSRYRSFCGASTGKVRRYSYTKVQKEILRQRHRSGRVS